MVQNVINLILESMDTTITISSTNTKKLFQLSQETDWIRLYNIWELFPSKFT
jgi:hypothetical protein